MITYSYKCNSCFEDFEVAHETLDDTANSPKCPFCGSTSITKTITYVPIIYKGEGFYSNDGKRDIGRPDISKDSTSDGG